MSALIERSRAARTPRPSASGRTVARRPYGQRHEIIDMRHYEVSRLRCRDSALLLYYSDIALQEAQHPGIAGYRAHDGVINICDERC